MWLEIQKLVLNGNLGEAIDLTYQLFPGILERNSNLLFALKVRQFIEMINSSNSNECTTGAAASSVSDSNDLKLISSKITALSTMNNDLNTASTTMIVESHTNGNSNNNNNGYSNNNFKYNSNSLINEEAMG